MKGAPCCSSCTTWLRAQGSGSRARSPARSSSRTTSSPCVVRFHADVIVDDVIYFDEPMFSDGLLAQTVDQVVNEGAAYFSSAGNNGLEAYQAELRLDFDRDRRGNSSRRARRTSTSTRWRRTDFPRTASITSTTVTAAPASRSGSRPYFGDIVDFQWDEPFDLGKVRTDYNIYVFDANGQFIDPNDPLVGRLLHER